MKSGHANGDKVFVCCFIVALLLHAGTLFYFHFSFLDKYNQPRTVPVVFVKKATTQQSPSKQTHSEAQATQTKEILTTKGNAEFSTPLSPSEKLIDRQGNQNSPNLPSLAANFRQNQASKNLQRLFSPDETLDMNQARQITTTAAAELSTYQIELRQHMLREDLYDSFHQYLKDNNQFQIDYELQLVLFPNGAIKNASVKSSSGVSDLDALALTAAFNASPYPQPPSEDLKQGFRYLVPFSYQRK